MSSNFKHISLSIVAFIIASAIWLPVVHLFFRHDRAEYSDTRGIPQKAKKLAARHMKLWEDDQLRKYELQKMRGSNAEWDFMGRTFLVLSLANMALREPESQEQCLNIIDQIIDDTLLVEKVHGMYQFLMPYARDSYFVQKPDRSQFIDGETALMMAARCVVAGKETYLDLLKQRVDIIVERMKNSPVLSTESYPDECWMFCNAAALAAVKISDYLSDTNHNEFIDMWLTTAKKRLIDPDTGILVSSFAYSGEHLDGPEGSSIWFVTNCLMLIDEEFARDQYERACKELGSALMGFGYAREWPDSWKGPIDIDSGPIIPVLNISAGSSGLAFVGASSFGDIEFLSSLLTTVDFAAFPAEKDGSLKYCASNQVGDAVILYALVLGPLWEKVKAEESK